MTYENRNYGKCANGRITEYAPSPLPWSKLHTETWTDEETGETHTDEWTETKRILHPTEAEYNDMGFYHIVKTNPQPESGYHAVSSTYEKSGNEIVQMWSYEKDEPKPIIISKAKVERKIDELGKTAIFTAWLNSKAKYLGAWLRGGDDVAYDPTDNASDLASLMAALGVDDNEVPALIAEVTA